MSAPLPDRDALDFLAALIDARGPSGYEGPVQAVWRARVEAVADTVEQDAYGNTWAALGPKDAPTLIISGHADEIGLMINHIESSGLVRVVAIGGVDPAVLPGRRVLAATADGPRLGVVGAVPIHLQTKTGERKAPKIEELFVDFGFADAAAARAVIGIGTTLTLADGFARLGERRAVSRAFDNRIGIYAAAEVLRRVAARRNELKLRLVALSTVQEEIGLRGAEIATRRLDPDMAIVFDVCHATDVPGISSAKHGDVQMGKGPTVTHGGSNHPALVRHVDAVAKRAQLPLQHEASGRFTGTDTDIIYRATRGVPSVLLSLPTRYMHTPAEVIDLGDLEHLVRLATEVVLALDGVPTSAG